ncbi:hypothetical protein YC2023_023109 [Brassica napus]
MSVTNLQLVIKQTESDTDRYFECEQQKIGTSSQASYGMLETKSMFLKHILVPTIWATKMHRHLVFVIAFAILNFDSFNDHSRHKLFIPSHSMDYK